MYVCLSRVSLTYRVKSAHKVKLTDKQLLQWMVPILLVMLIYLGTWTLSATPSAEEVGAMLSGFFLIAVAVVIFVAAAVAASHWANNIKSFFSFHSF